MNKEYNIALFEQVKAAIRAEYKRANIWIWQKKVTWDDGPACGVVGCISGWADILDRTKGDLTPEAIKKLTLVVDPDGLYDSNRSARLLGLSEEEQDVLFDPANWPIEWRTKIDRTAAGTPKHGEVICGAIDAFLANPEEFCYEYEYGEPWEDRDDDQSRSFR